MDESTFVLSQEVIGAILNGQPLDRARLDAMLRSAEQLANPAPTR